MYVCIMYVCMKVCLCVWYECMCVMFVMVRNVCNVCMYVCMHVCIMYVCMYECMCVMLVMVCNVVWISVSGPDPQQAQLTEPLSFFHCKSVRLHFTKLTNGWLDPTNAGSYRSKQAKRLRMQKVRLLSKGKPARKPPF